MAIELSIDQQALQALTRALRAEDDGKKLRRDLANNLRHALEPAVADIKSGVMALGSAGLSTAGGGLAAAVAKNVKAEARLTGRSTGARIRIRTTPGVRGFTHAPRRVNSPKGWRHPVFGDRDTWVQQIGVPGFFDRPIAARRTALRAAVLEAMEDMAERIANAVRNDSRSS